MTTDLPLFGTETDPREQEREARARRTYALAGMLQTVRARRGWSVETAAAHAGIGHMTWRRAEQGVPSRLKTYAALDRLFGLPPGAVNRATRSDEHMVALAGALDIDACAEHAASAAEWVAKFAEGAAAGSPAGRVMHQDRAAPGNPDLPGALAALSLHTPAAVPTDLQVATDLVERMRAHADAPEVREAIQAVLRAIPAMIGVAVRDAERELTTHSAPPSTAERDVSVARAS